MCLICITTVKTRCICNGFILGIGHKSAHCRNDVFSINILLNYFFCLRTLLSSSLVKRRTDAELSQLLTNPSRALAMMTSQAFLAARSSTAKRAKRAKRAFFRVGIDCSADRVWPRVLSLAVISNPRVVSCCHSGIRPPDTERSSPPADSSKAF